MNALTRRTLLAGSLGLLGTGALAACSPPAETPTPAESPAHVTSGSTTATAITHVHAITRDPDTGVVLLATHQGLFCMQERELTRIGPVIDLMGFTTTPEGRYLASGHPGPGTDLPEPVGLSASTDQGESWEVLSRSGESDFHALAAGPEGVIAFDGQLRTSTDGRTWTTLQIPSAPAALAIAPNRGRYWPPPSKACCAPTTTEPPGTPWTPRS